MLKILKHVVTKVISKSIIPKTTSTNYNKVISDIDNMETEMDEKISKIKIDTPVVVDRSICPTCGKPFEDSWFKSLFNITTAMNICTLMVVGVIVGMWARIIYITNEFIHWGTEDVLLLTTVIAAKAFDNKTSAPIKMKRTEYKQQVINKTKESDNEHQDKKEEVKPIEEEEPKFTTEISSDIDSKPKSSYSSRE